MPSTNNNMWKSSPNLPLLLSTLWLTAAVRTDVELINAKPPGMISTMKNIYVIRTRGENPGCSSLQKKQEIFVQGILSTPCHTGYHNFAERLLNFTPIQPSSLMIEHPLWTWRHWPETRYPHPISSYVRQPPWVHRLLVERPSRILVLL